MRLVERGFWGGRFAVLLLTPTAFAQTPATTLADVPRVLETGRKVVVTESEGRRTKGRVAEITPSSITLLVRDEWGTERRQVFSDSGIRTITTLPTSGSFPIQRRSPQTGDPFDNLSPELYQLRIKLDQRLIDAIPATIEAAVVLESSEGQREALARLLNSRKAESNPFSASPVVVLTRGLQMSNGLAENHAGLARVSKNSRHTVVADSGHEVHLFTPAAVIQAVQDVSTAIRQRSQLPPR